MGTLVTAFGCKLLVGGWNPPIPALYQLTLDIIVPATQMPLSDGWGNLQNGKLSRCRGVRLCDIFDFLWDTPYARFIEIIAHIERVKLKDNQHI